MAKKDFSNVNTGNVYATIAQATQEDHETAAAQENKPKRKARKTYTEEEALQMLETLQTSGHKGVKLPRINMALTKSNHDYISTLARVRGENMTQFINHIIDEHREAHADIYQRAIEFKNSL